MKMYVNIENYDILLFNRFISNSLNDILNIVDMDHFRSSHDNDNALSLANISTLCHFYSTVFSVRTPASALGIILHSEETSVANKRMLHRDCRGNYIIQG